MTSPMTEITNSFDSERLLAAMRRAVSLERDALDLLVDSLGRSAIEALKIMRSIKGRVICSGVGKSGHVARKIAATLASTGTPAQFVHPTEASHGDLGMITTDDCVLALSNSGETRELNDLINYCQLSDVHLIGMTSRADSSLTQRSSVALLLPEAEEACGETKAPTTSTTLMMAYGDALAVALIEARGFTSVSFKRFHPGGALGSALGSALTRVSDMMHAGQELPLIGADAVMSEALAEMTTKGFGCVGVISDTGQLLGMVTDGDLRRHMSHHLVDQSVLKIMTTEPQTVTPNDQASVALRKMTVGERKITQLFVCDEANKPVGLLHIHDLLGFGSS